MLLCLPRLTKYIPTELNGHPFPSDRQTAFLNIESREVLFGGAAGGGKSAALLAAALQYVDITGYHALILRRTYAQLSKPGALMDMAQEWLRPTDAVWNQQEHKWKFPSGATLSFGHMENAVDRFNFQGAQWQFVAFDELTQFEEEPYRYLFSRMRKASDEGIPVRMRAASNPGGTGHEWVKKRWGIKAGKGTVAGRPFVAAYLRDNPGLNQADYEASLSELDPITRAQLLAGDWDAFQGGRFKREWFKRFEIIPNPLRYKLAGKTQLVDDTQCWRLVICDPAASEKEAADYTAIGTGIVTPERDLLLIDMVREHLPIDEIVPMIRSVCERWKPLFVAIEGSGFQIGIVRAAEKCPGIPGVVKLDPEGKGKLVRATPAIVRCERGQVYLLDNAPWLEDFESELVQFTGNEKEDAHDDQVDCLAYMVQQLDRSGPFKSFAASAPKRPVIRESNAERRGLWGRH